MSSSSFKLNLNSFEYFLTSFVKQIGRLTAFSWSPWSRLPSSSPTPPPSASPRSASPLWSPRSRHCRRIWLEMIGEEKKLMKNTICSEYIDYIYLPKLHFKKQGLQLVFYRFHCGYSRRIFYHFLDCSNKYIFF